MAQIVQTDDAISIASPPIRLAFRWDGRRWSHAIEAGGRPVAASLEWEPGRDDPAPVVSPTYQQAGCQDGPAGAQAMLVGQWGAHHGSAVFTVADDATGVVVEVDVAVRSRAALDALSSTYTVDRSSSDLVDAGPASVVWTLDDPPGGRLRFETGGPELGTFRVGLAEAGRRLTRVQAGADIAPGSATQRLVYRWRWLRDPRTPTGPADLE